MMRLVTARRRADAFAEAVDHRSADAPIADEHRAFLDLVGQLRDLDEPVLREDFSADLRARLMAEAPVALAERAPRTDRSRHDSSVVSFPSSPRRRTATAAAAACIVLGSTAGVAAASLASLPGETLYPVKRGIEHIEVTVAGSQHAKGSEYLDQATTRLDEITNLTVAHADDPETPALVSQTLKDFASRADDGANALMTSYRNDQDGSSISELRAFTDESARRLDALTSSVPSSAAGALADAADVLTQLDKTARSLCPICSSLPPLSLSGALIDLQDSSSTAPVQPVVPGAPATVSPQKNVPTAADPSLTTGPATQPQTAGGPTPPDNTAQQPGLPTIPTAVEPTGGTPAGAGNPGPNHSPGVSVPLPGGGITVATTAPSVPLPPLPTVDLTDPVGSVPSVLDNVTTALDVPELP